jgi:hypothetical protein
MKTFFSFVAFPKIMRYFNEFAESLNKQTDKDFEIIAVCENVDANEVRKLLKNYKVNCIEKSNSNSVKNRKDLVSEAVKLDADNIIFGDCDDFFSSNRIANTREYLREYDIVFNELELYGDGIKRKEVIGSRISNESNFRKEILSKNFIGFSNSGLNLKIVDKNFFIPDDINAADWWVYSYVMLKNKCKVYFDSSAVTYYRQHENNIIGWNKFYSKEDIISQADEKIKHYKYLSRVCSKYEESIKIEMQKTIDFKKNISDNDYFNKHKCFISKLSKKINLFWWEHLQPIERLGELL